MLYYITCGNYSCIEVLQNWSSSVENTTSWKAIICHLTDDGCFFVCLFVCDFVVFLVEGEGGGVGSGGGGGRLLGGGG